MQNKRFLISVLLLILASCAAPGERERLLKSIEKKMIESNKRMENLRIELNNLEDSVFLVNDRLKSLEERQKKLEEKYNQLKLARIKGHERKKNDQATSGRIKPRKVVIPADEINDPVKIYRRAYDLIMSGKCPESIPLMEYILNKFKDHSLADNAAYWIGECYYDAKNYDQALHYFYIVIDEFSSGNKVPDAMLKVGYTYEKKGDKERAIEELKKLIEQFPFSEPSKKAKIKIKSLTQE